MNIKFFDKVFDKKLRPILTPNEFQESIFTVDYTEKRRQGIKYILFDLDGTLVPFDSLEVDKKTIGLINELKYDFYPLLYSDGSKRRVKPVAEKLDIPYIYRSLKPYGSFKRIKEVLGDNCTPDNTMLIGNISYLDTPFAKRNNIYNILVDTIHNENNIIDKICDIPQSKIIKKIK